MTSAENAADVQALSIQQGRTYVRLLNLLALGQILLFLSTSLWFPPFRFPQVPLLSMMRSWPVWLETAVAVGTLAGTFFAKSNRWQSRLTRRLRHGICAVCFLILIGCNQHRLQPWAYQFLILHAWLALASPRWMLTGWRWLTISIYFYSALSKLDYSFCTTHGPFLWDGFLHVFGIAEGTSKWPANVQFAAAALMPVTELIAAGCLCVRRTQRLGLFLTLAMHLFLIVALSPWGHNHSVGVLIWNVFFIVQNWLLFPSPISLAEPFHSRFREAWDSSSVEMATPEREQTSRYAWLSMAAWGLLAIPLCAPLLEPFGLWDHWPSWAVYAARPERTRMQVHEDDLHRLPEELRKYVEPPALLELWHPLRLDRWSLAATRTPIYPQDRFQIGVALAVAERHRLTTIKLIIDGPPDRWSGRRERREVEGLENTRELAQSFRLNALPRLE